MEASVASALGFLNTVFASVCLSKRLGDAFVFSHHLLCYVQPDQALVDLNSPL